MVAEESCMRTLTLFCLTAWSSLFLIVCLGGEALGASSISANWRFGKVQITDLGGGRVTLYLSLQNHGVPSQERVHLSIVPSQTQAPLGLSTLLLTDRTRGQRSTVVQASVSLPARVLSASPENYRVFLQVDYTITDMFPVERGRPNLQASERRKFQQ